MPALRIARATSLALLLGMAAVAPLPFIGEAQAQDAGWSLRVDRTTGYRVEVPLALLQPVEAGPDDPRSVQSFASADGSALLETYAGANLDNMSLDGFMDFLASADRIAEVTYSRNGRSWFVLSGYYRRAGYEDESLIFYAKFMFTPGLERFSAFEISYPAAQRNLYDPVVERIEDSLRAPMAG